MANVSFANLAQDLDINDMLVTFMGGPEFGEEPNGYFWNSSNGNKSFFGGSGFTYYQLIPIGGTVASLTLDLSDDAPLSPDIAITGLSFNLALLAPMTDGSLTTAGQQNDLYWRTVLSGDDTIDFGSSGFTIDFAGDGRNVGDGQILFGGNDTMTGDLNGGNAQGDFEVIESGGTLFAGDDVINVSGASVYGDAYRVSGTLVGGNDTISVSGGNAQIFGDAFYLHAGAILAGGDDIINGGDGDDIIGGDVDSVQTGSGFDGGDDEIHGGGGGDVIFGDWEFKSGTARGGDDLLFGDAGDDTIHGNGGNDTLTGGAGADTMFGGAGDDTFYVDNAGDHAFEAFGEGNDRVFASVSYALEAGQSIQFLAATGQAGTDAIDLTGNEFAQTIQGNQGSNLIDGRGGADIMQGFGGDDFYYVDNAGDQVIEVAGGGIDAVYSSLESYTLAATADVEILNTNAISGTAAIDLTGNELAQTIQGNQGANILDGRGGADYLQGFGGNDFYYVDNAADRVVEVAGGGGADAVYASVDYTLAAGVEVETLNTSFTGGTTAINLKGNDLAQTVRGNGGNNSVYGGGGDDTLIGGLGRDAMKGEAGDDVFDFNTAAETGINANTRDKIADFTHGQDIIDLSTIDANGALAGDAFNYIGVAGFNHVAGELRYVQVDNVDNALDETIIEADIDGNGIADFQIALTGLVNLSVGDFVV